MAIDKLISLLNSVSPINDFDAELISKHLKHDSVKAETIIINRQEIADKLIYLNTGLCMCFSIDSDNLMRINEFYDAGSIITDFDSFFSRRPSNTCLMALEDCDYYYLTYEDREKINKTSINLALMTAKLNEILYLKTKEHYEDYIKLSLQERYLKLLNSNPELFQRVPLKYIAEYLNVRPQSLSRIRKNIFNKKHKPSSSSDSGFEPTSLSVKKPTKN